MDAETLRIMALANGILMMVLSPNQAGEEPTPDELQKRFDKLKDNLVLRIEQCVEPQLQIAYFHKVLLCFESFFGSLTAISNQTIMEIMQRRKELAAAEEYKKGMH